MHGQVLGNELAKQSELQVKKEVCTSASASYSLIYSFI